MDLTDALAFARDRRQGVLATIRANGRPQLSNIMFVPGDGDTLHHLGHRQSGQDAQPAPRSAGVALRAGRHLLAVRGARGDGRAVAGGEPTRTTPPWTLLVDYYRTG